MSRQKSREEAFKILYASEVGGDYQPDNPSDFTLELVEGIKQNHQQINQQLSEQLADWSLERIFPVERVILRLGLYELLYQQTGRAIVINEAVELAKKFGDRNSASFVNGILDNFKGGDEHAPA